MILGLRARWERLRDSETVRIVRSLGFLARAHWRLETGNVWGAFLDLALAMNLSPEMAKDTPMRELFERMTASDAWLYEQVELGLQSRYYLDAIYMLRQRYRDGMLDTFRFVFLTEREVAFIKRGRS